jgi:hypothetical protein
MVERLMRQEKVEATAAQMTDANERGTSQLIGGLMVYGLALGGLGIGYSSAMIQWVSTGVLAVIGSVLTVSGLWALIKR